MKKILLTRGICTFRVVCCELYHSFSRAINGLDYSPENQKNGRSHPSKRGGAPIMQCQLKWWINCMSVSRMAHRSNNHAHSCCSFGFGTEKMSTLEILFFDTMGMKWAIFIWMNDINETNGHIIISYGIHSRDWSCHWIFLNSSRRDKSNAIYDPTTQPNRHS